MNPLYLMIAASIPAALVGTMSWYGMYTFVNAYVIRGLGCTNQQWTLATLWCSGGMIFWYLVCTEISARLGRRLTVTLGLASTAFGYGVMACTHSVFVIDLLLALMGFTTVANAAVWMPLVAEASADRPGRGLALNAFIGTAVGLLSLLCGGRLVADGNYPRSFLIIAAACAVSAVAFHILAGPLEKGEQTKVVRMFDIPRADLLATIRGPFLFVLLFGVCMDPFSFHSVNQIFPNLVRDVHGFSEADTSTLVAMGRVPALVALYAVSRLIDRVNVLRWYAIALMLDGVLTIAIGLAAGKASVTAAYLAYYVAHGVVWGTSVAAVNLCLPKSIRDTGFAVTWLLEILAVFAVGIVHNRLLQNGLTLNYTFGVCGVVLAVMGVVLILYSYTQHSTRMPA